MARGRQPITGKVPSASRAIAVGAPPAPRNWQFSFKYYRQIEYFGTGNQDSPWFVALLDKLSELCNKRVEDILNNPSEKLFWRMHPIDWNHKNIPIKPSDLTWIDKRYTENQEEFPFWQFSVSKALGRVVGFWDERGTFNLVLLDPMHNIQPSKFSDYKLRETNLGKGEYEIAINRIESMIGACGEECKCRGLYSEIQSNLTYRLEFSTMLISMPDELFKRVGMTVESGVVTCVSELLEFALAGLEDNKSAG